MNALRIGFLGSASFAVPTLKVLARSEFEIAAVYTRAPRPAGRGRKVHRTPVHECADEFSIPVRTPDTLKDANVQTEFRALSLDLAVVASYGLILPREILVAPRLGCVNLHPSLLPRWRGAAPVVHTLHAGDAVSGVSLMKMNTGLDSGPVISQREVAVPPHATTEDFESELAEIAADMLMQMLNDPERALSNAEPQDDDKVTWASKLQKRDGAVDWSLPANKLERMVRAFSPRPGAFFELGRTNVRILDASVVPGAGQPGEILDRELTVACGEDALRLHAVRMAGKSTIGGAAFLRGIRLGPGDIICG